MANHRGGIIRVIRALAYSWRGISAALRYEAAFRQEVLLALIAIFVACWLKVDTTTRLLLIGSVLLVLIVELLNSAIEALTDRIGDEWHELSGRAKDMGSAAVLLALILALMTWGLILRDYFY